LLGWLEVTGSSKVTWLAGDEKKRLDGATGQAAGAVVSAASRPRGTLQAAWRS
jgi:hypothetical protein